MTGWTYIRRSLGHYWRTHLGVLAGAALATAVLVGALAVGDCVRGSLTRTALQRVGGMHVAMLTADRFFRTSLADQVAASLNAPAAPVLMLDGIASSETGLRANSVQVLGVDERFWRMGDVADPLKDASDDHVVLNVALARQLHVTAGQQVLLRVSKPSLLPREAPLSVMDNYSFAFRATVQAVVGPEAMGRFSLQANQVAPYNAMVKLSALARRCDLWGQAPISQKDAKLASLPKDGEHAGDEHRGQAPISQEDAKLVPVPKAKANLLLVGAGPEGAMSPAAAQAAVDTHWQLSDAELEVRALPNGFIELRGGGVFLPAPVARAARAARPGAAGVMAYFVNELRAGEHTAPYSLVAAVGDLDESTKPARAARATGRAKSPATATTATVPAILGLVPPDLKEGQIVINQWLADDLGVAVGQSLEMKYFVWGPLRRLEERSSSFVVRAVLPMSGPAVDRSLMPDFPGIADVEDCRNWKAGIPLDISKIRPKDRQYWDDYRGTPKAFVPLAQGQAMWANPFGTLTSVRWKSGPDPGADAQTLARELRARIKPAELGFGFQPIRQRALEASSQSMDFGLLFLGLSMFLVIAALLLMGLVLGLGIDQRSAEMGLLMALGLPGRRVKWLLTGEAMSLVVLAAPLGVAAGLAYTAFMLARLGGVWSGAVAGAEISFHVRPITIVIASGAAAAMAAGTIWLVLRRRLRLPARKLLAWGAMAGSPVRRQRWRNVKIAIAAAAAIGAGLLIGFARRLSAGEAAGVFFGAGSLVLIAGLLAVSLWQGRDVHAALSIFRLGIRAASRRPGRSLATVALLACGVFLIAAVAANRPWPPRDPSDPRCGTGGFTLIARSALPVMHDLNLPAGQRAFGLAKPLPPGASVVGLRVRDGDDASCLNLNRPQMPRLVGVDEQALARRGAFTFAAVAEGTPGGSGWALLSGGSPDEIPAIADETTAVWSLHMRPGEAIDYTDQHGKTVKVRLVGLLANSILQGNLVISAENFQRHFPATTGYRMLLIDAPAAEASAVAAALSKAGEDVGLEVTPAAARLEQFNAVQNTYLAIFQVLGGLGLVLGSIGLGAVLMRNVMERRGQLAVLSAVGFSRWQVVWLVLAEHLWLLGAGLACGVVSAAVAAAPAVGAEGARSAMVGLSYTLAAVVEWGLGWTILSAWVATDGPLLAALRNE